MSSVSRMMITSQMMWNYIVLYIFNVIASADYLNVNHNKMTLGGIEPRGIHPIVLCHRFRRPVLGQEPMDRFKREAYVRSSG